MTDTTLARERQNRPETYLSLKLSGETTGIVPMRSDRNRRGTDGDPHVQEVLTLAIDRLTPLPGRPRWVMGLLNQRGRIFGVIDLADFLGFPPLAEEEQNPGCALIRVESLAVGLAVGQIGGILRTDRDRVRSIQGQVPPSVEPYLQGRVSRVGEDLAAGAREEYLVLDTGAIVRGVFSQ